MAAVYQRGGPAFLVPAASDPARTREPGRSVGQYAVAEARSGDGEEGGHGMCGVSTSVVSALVICGWMSAAAAVQAPPDFSGDWVLDPAPAEPAPVAAGASQLRPDQRRLPSGDMGSGWGSPLTIAQDAARLVVEQTLFSRYDLQPPLRFVYALDGSQTRNTAMIGHATQTRVSRASWDGQALIVRTDYPGVNPVTRKPFTTEVTHRLSLESPDTLVVEVTRGAALGGQPTTARAVYRRR